MVTNLENADVEVHKKLEEEKAEYEGVKARHILIRTKGSGAPAGGKKELTDEEALEKAKALRTQIVAGGDFATIPKAESDDPGSGANGGDLNSLWHRQIVPPFAQTPFS